MRIMVAEDQGIDNCVILDDNCGKSTVGTRAIGILSNASTFSG